MTPFQELTGAVIAGGSSRRMGRDKRLLLLEGKTLLERAVDLLSGLCDEVLYAAPEPPPVSIPARHAADRFPGLGVLSGIHAALSEARNPFVICVPVDTPLLTPAWLELLARSCFERGLPVCPRIRGRVHPIPGCYPRSSLAVVEAALASGDLAGHALLAKTGAFFVEEECARAEGCDPASLANVNTPQEWKALLAVFQFPR